MYESQLSQLLACYVRLGRGRMLPVGRGWVKAKNIGQGSKAPPLRREGAEKMLKLPKKAN